MWSLSLFVFSIMPRAFVIVWSCDSVVLWVVVVWYYGRARPQSSVFDILFGIFFFLSRIFFHQVFSTTTQLNTDERHFQSTVFGCVLFGLCCGTKKRKKRSHKKKRPRRFFSSYELLFFCVCRVKNRPER